jgi:hypothetical protein
MSADLGFSEAVYGFGAGLFFVGYILLEFPARRSWRNGEGCQSRIPGVVNQNV